LLYSWDYIILWWFENYCIYLIYWMRLHVNIVLLGKWLYVWCKILIYYTWARNLFMLNAILPFSGFFGRRTFMVKTCRIRTFEMAWVPEDNLWLPRFYCLLWSLVYVLIRSLSEFLFILICWIILRNHDMYDDISWDVEMLVLCCFTLWIFKNELCMFLDYWRSNSSNLVFTLIYC